MTFDPTAGRIYLSIEGQERVGGTGFLPVIHAFDVTIPTPSSLPPQIGTLCATFDKNIVPLVITGPSGTSPTGFPIMFPAIPSGTILTLTAGNVYARTSGATISSIVFKHGVTILGTGTPSVIVNGENNYVLTGVDTTSWSSGLNTLTVQATDSNSVVSNTVSYTLTIA